VGTQLIHNKNLDLGKRILDPRGTYTCNGTEELAKEVSTLQVYFRSMCSLIHWGGVGGDFACDGWKGVW
jgi:hypothetical protein